MNKATQFIRKHALAILVVAVALAVPFGVASAKYTTTATVTTDLTVKVEATYELDTTKLETRLTTLKDGTNGTAPTTIKFVKGNDSAISSLTATHTSGIQSNNSQPIGTFLSSDKLTVYVAAMTSEGKPATTSTEALYSKDQSTLEDYFSGLTGITVDKGNLKYYN